MNEPTENAAPPAPMIGSVNAPILRPDLSKVAQQAAESMGPIEEGSAADPSFGIESSTIDVEYTPQQAAPTPEAAPDPEAQPHPEQFEKQFKLLASKEAELQRLRAETEQKLASFDDQLNTKLKERLSQSPLKALEEAGWTFEDLAKAVIAGDEKSYEKETKSPYVRQLQEKIDSLESRLNQTDQQREYQSHIDVLQQSITKNAEEYPLVARTPQADQVLYNMFAAAHEKGESLTIEGALEGLEAHLLEQRNLYMDVPKYQTAPKPSATPQLSKKPPVINTVPPQPYQPTQTPPARPMSLGELAQLAARELANRAS